MQTVSAELLNIQQGHEFQYYRKVQLYRRYWNGTAYVMAAALDISDYVIKCGDISFAQDPILGEWKVANLTLTVKNNAEEFSRYDSSPTNLFNGYIVEYSEVDIELGYMDGTTERGVTVFTGVLGKKSIEEDKNNETAKIYVRGKNASLERFSAEDLAGVNFTGQALVNSGDNKSYDTTPNGIGKFKKVYSNGVLQTLNTDYDVSSLNDYSNPGRVTFGADQGANPITADFVKWYEDKTFKFLIEALLDHAGETDYSVQDVNFPNNVAAYWEIDTQAEFDAGTKENVRSFADDTLYQDEILGYESVFAEWTSIDNNLAFSTRVYQRIYINETMVAMDGYCYARNLDPLVGVNISAQIRKDNGLGTGPDLGVGGAATIISNSVTVPANTATAYRCDMTTMTGTLTAGNYYWMVFSAIGVAGVPYTAGTVSIAGRHTSFYPDGYIVVHLNPPAGAQTSYSTHDVYCAIQANDGRQFCNYVLNNSEDGYWMSDTFDIGTALAAWGSLVPDEDVTTGVITYYTLTKDADAGWPVAFDPADWDEVVGGVITSTIYNNPDNCYIRVACKIVSSSSANYIFRHNVNIITVNYYLSQFDIKLADWTGLNVKQAINEKALIANYKYGYRGPGTFFFSSKNSGTSPDFTLFGVTKIDILKIDFDKIKNRVNAVFGSYEHTTDSDTEGESSPHSIDKFGVQVLNISGGNLLNNNDVDVATGSSESNYNQYNAEKWFCKIQAKIIPQIELDDLIRLSIDDTGATTVAEVFDAYTFDLHTFGCAGLPYGLIFRIIGIRFKTDSYPLGGMELSLLEV